MRKKRLVALLLVVAMIASMVVPSVAAEDAYTVSIVDNATGAATIDANPGDEVTLKMVLSNNPGVSSVFVNIDYPEGWTVKGYEDKELFADEAATTPQFSPLTNNPFSCIWVMPTGTKTTLEDAGMQLPTQNGELFLIQFQIPADAELGTYTVDLDTTSNGDLVDGNFAYETYEDGTINPEERHNLTLATQGMTINVTEPEPEAPVYDPAQVACPCASCNGAVPTWEVWDEAKAAEGGHFYLTEAATLSAEITIPANVTTVINLSGQTMTAASGKRAFTVAADGALYIIDGTEDDKGTLQGGGTALASGTHGGVVYANDGRFELHDATVTGGEVTAARGGNIYGNYDNSVIVINNGKVLDGAGTGTTRGGNICVYYGTLYVYGEDAEISGGDASAKGYGGNIYVGNAGKLNMYGGTVSGGTAKYGQDVCGLGNAANHANIYMYGGTVGTAEVDECAYIYGSASSQVCHFYLYGGTVYGFTDTGTYNTIALYNGIIEADPTTINSDGSSALAACACVVKTGDTYTIWNYKHAAGTCTEDCKYEEALAADEEDNNYSIVQ
ncbi:MAG: hypothetical protein IJZ56_01820, partial [Oscillospiraceae bacterium]|nr:hypothetical protein [Oscillospiraceae bacterium]